jgi:hypothetical protein
LEYELQVVSQAIKVEREIILERVIGKAITPESWLRNWAGSVIFGSSLWVDYQFRNGRNVAGNI